RAAVEPASARTLAEMLTSPDEVARVRHLRSAAADLIEVRIWRRSDKGWSPAEGFTFPVEQLPEFRRTLAHAEALVRDEAPAETPEEGSLADRERIRIL